MEWILFALLAPVFFAVTIIIDKYAIDKITKGVYDFLFYLAIIDLFFSLIIYFFFDIDFSNIGFLALISGLIIAPATLYYGKAIENNDVSLVTPVFNTIPIFLLLMSYFIDGKNIENYQLFSFFVIFIGAIIISTVKKFLIKFKLSKGFYYMLISSFLFATIFFISDIVVGKTNVATVAFFEGIGFFFGVIYYLFFKKSRKEICLGVNDISFKKVFISLGNSIFNKLGMVTTYKAFSLAPIPALVSVVGGIQPFIVLSFTIILSIFFPKIIKEDINKNKIIKTFIGIIIIFTGVSILYLY